MRKSGLFVGLIAVLLNACGTGGMMTDDGGTMSGNEAGTMMGADAARSDAGGTGTDAARTEAGAPREAGMTNPNDRCNATDMNAASTIGCNGGYVMGDPAANAAGGTCTGGGDANPAGTCTGMAFCGADMGMMGRCLPTCTPNGSSYVSTGGCPTGFRCFNFEGEGVCFRDCDQAHPCSTGQMCDNEGSCVDP